EVQGEVTEHGLVGFTLDGTDGEEAEVRVNRPRGPEYLGVVERHPGAHAAIAQEKPAVKRYRGFLPHGPGVDHAWLSLFVGLDDGLHHTANELGGVRFGRAFFCGFPQVSVEILPTFRTIRSAFPVISA